MPTSRRWLLALGVCLGLLVVPLAAVIWLDDPPPAPTAKPYSPRAPSPDPAAPTERNEDGARILFGTVRDLEGEPVAEADVTIEGRARIATVSGADGAYRLLSVPLTVVTLVADADGFAPTEITIGQGEIGAEERYDVTLERSEGPRGLVVDPEGEPVAGVSVGCLDRPDDPMIGAVTDEEGRFETLNRPSDAEGRPNTPVTANRQRWSCARATATASPSPSRPRWPVRWWTSEGNPSLAM